MIAITAVAVTLVTLHMIDGRVVQINPRQVTQLISPLPGNPNRALVEGVHCVVRLTDGSFLSVAEDCGTVRKLMEEKP